MRKRTISIVTLGCPKNQVDSEHIASSLVSPEIMIAHSEQYADTVLINTCGFIHDAKEQSVDTILEYVKAKKEGKIRSLIVFGCLVERYRDELQLEIPEVDRWFGVKESNRIVHFLNSDSKLSANRKYEMLSTPKHYAYLKISEGCDRKCSFCAIPFIRGKHISRPMDEILGEATELVRNGVSELIIIAQDTTYYGIDLYGKKMLPQLLDLLATESGANWIRLHYAYPAGFPKELPEIIAKHDNICKYIDIPFQHVDNHILTSMKRFHTYEDMIYLIKLLRNTIPGVHIRTGFITGFPGEDKAAFNKLADFLSEYKLERVGFFSYSEEEGTSAARLTDDVHHITKLQRLQKLTTIQEQVSLENNKNKIGKKMKIIIDEVNDNAAIGRTEFDSPEIDNLVSVKLKKKGKVIAGDIMTVQITDADPWELYAEISENVMTKKISTN